MLGASTLERLDANLVAVDGPPPDPGTVERCDAVWGMLRGPALDYNR